MNTLFNNTMDKVDIDHNNREEGKLKQVPKQSKVKLNYAF